MRGLPDKPRFTVAEAARAWSVSSRTVYRWIERRKIVVERTPGGDYRIPRACVILCQVVEEGLVVR